jgi:hypothetical protein
VLGAERGAPDRRIQWPGAPRAGVGLQDRGDGLTQPLATVGPLGEEVSGPVGLSGAARVVAEQVPQVAAQRPGGVQGEQPVGGGQQRRARYRVQRRCPVLVVQLPSGIAAGPPALVGDLVVPTGDVLVQRLRQGVGGCQVTAQRPGPAEQVGEVDQVGEVAAGAGGPAQTLHPVGGGGKRVQEPLLSGEHRRGPDRRRSPTRAAAGPPPTTRTHDAGRYSPRTAAQPGAAEYGARRTAASARTQSQAGTPDRAPRRPHLITRVPPRRRPVARPVRRQIQFAADICQPNAQHGQLIPGAVMRPQPDRAVDHPLIKRSYALLDRRHHAIETDRCPAGRTTVNDAPRG